MDRRGVLQRAVEADVRAGHDERGSLRLGLGPVEREVDLGEVVAVDRLDVPAVGFEASSDVLGERQVGRPVDRDAVVVVEVDELAEPEVARERGGLARHALHEVPVRH
jgi:hypothetical protein